MNISAIASLSTQLAQQRASESAQISLLKKAMEIQQATASTLIASVTPAANLPSHLGQNINVVA